MDLSVTIGGVYYPSLISNAAGTAKTVKQIYDLAHSLSGVCRDGSHTVPQRNGNAGPRVFWEDREQLCSVNSLGIPSVGLHVLKKELPIKAEVAHKEGKPLVVSWAGFSPEEYAAGACVLDCGADVLEINAGCPNLYIEGKQKPILSYHPQSLREVLEKVEKAIGSSRMERVGVKVSPFVWDTDYFQMFGIEIHMEPPGIAVFEEVASVIAQFGVSHVIACNTVPNAHAEAEDGKPAINSPDVPSGCGGLAGKIVMEVCLEEVRRWRAALPARIIVVGAGGISNGHDVDDYVQAGASAVQIGTKLYTSGNPRSFLERVTTEYLDSMEPPPEA